MKIRRIFLIVIFLSGYNLAFGQQELSFSAALSEAMADSEINLPRMSGFNRQIQATIYQDSLRTAIITLKDGNEFVGKVLEENDKIIRIKTETYGEMSLEKARIKSITYVENAKIMTGVLWKDHMQSTRYFWQPNGYGLKKGEAYYQNVWVLFNQFSVGVTDNFLIGGGIIPLFLFAWTPTPVWVTPKVSFPVVEDKLNIGVGGLFATVIGDLDYNLGIFYSSATFGSRDRNFTLGVGYGYSDGSWANRPLFSASFLSRVGAKGYFITENYIIQIDRQYGVLSMIGGRNIIGNGAGLDYGLVIPFFPDMGTFFAIPWLGVTIPLSSKN